MTPSKTQDLYRILKTALPLMAAFLAQKGIQLVDTLMMGKIGPAALAAGAMGIPIFFLLLLFCTGTLSAVGVFIARSRGAEKTQDIAIHLQQGVYLALLLSAPCMLILWSAPHWVMLVNHDAPVINNIRLLLHAMMWGFPGFLLFLVYREFIAAFFQTRIVMIVAIIAIPLAYALTLFF